MHIAQSIKGNTKNCLLTTVITVEFLFWFSFFINAIISPEAHVELVINCRIEDLTSNVFQINCECAQLCPKVDSNTLPTEMQVRCFDQLILDWLSYSILAL
jgi:hypothetical protein